MFRTISDHEKEIERKRQNTIKLIDKWLNLKLQAERLNKNQNYIPTIKRSLILHINASKVETKHEL